MEEFTPQTVDNQTEENNSDSGIVWLIKGLVFPCWSGPFYKKATQKRVIVAILFLILFAIVQTSIVSIQVFFSLKGFGGEIEKAYQQGEIPTISIEDGVAAVSDNEPYIFSQNRQFFGLDTTGQTQEIDTQAYSEGILITQTELHFVNEDGYQVLPLVELHEFLGNPIIIDQAQVLNLWGTLRLFIHLLIGIGGFLWNTFIRFGYVAMLGLVVWGVVSLFQKETTYKQILITGIYAMVPTFYLNYTLKQIGFSFFGFFTLILLVVWGIAVRYVVKPPAEAETGILLS